MPLSPPAKSLFYDIGRVKRSSSCRSWQRQSPARLTRTFSAVSHARCDGTAAAFPLSGVCSLLCFSGSKSPSPCGLFTMTDLYIIPISFVQCSTPLYFHSLHLISICNVCLRCVKISRRTCAGYFFMARYDNKFCHVPAGYVAIRTKARQQTAAIATSRSSCLLTEYSAQTHQLVRKPAINIDQAFDYIIKCECVPNVSQKRVDLRAALPHQQIAKRVKRRQLPYIDVTTYQHFPWHTTSTTITHAKPVAGRDCPRLRPSDMSIAVVRTAPFADVRSRPSQPSITVASRPNTN